MIGRIVCALVFAVALYASAVKACDGQVQQINACHSQAIVQSYAVAQPLVQAVYVPQYVAPQALVVKPQRVVAARKPIQVQRQRIVVRSR